MNSSKSKSQQEKTFDDEEDTCDDDCQSIFPQRLMSVLGDERNHDSICWLPHGRAFVIRNRNMFGERVMPKFFPRKSKYSSFTRKLNRWNFVRVSSGPELGAYYHEFFLRDKPHLAAQMFCKNARTKIAMASSDPSPATALAYKVEAQPTKEPQPQKQQQGIDAAHIFLMRQQMDPSMQFLLEQQLRLGHQHINGQMRQQQCQLLQQQPEPVINMLQASSATPSSSLALEMRLQKQKQERFVQLQHLMALNNMKRQQKRMNNFRASAA